jgi:hypothetical protein
MASNGLIKHSLPAPHSVAKPTQSMPPRDRSITITHQGQKVTWKPRDYVLPPLRLVPGEIEFPLPCSTHHISTGVPPRVLLPAQAKDTKPIKQRIFATPLKFLPLVEDSKPLRTKRLTVMQRLKHALHIGKRPPRTKAIDTGVSGMSQAHMESSFTTRMKSLWRFAGEGALLDHHDSALESRVDVRESSFEAEPDSYRVLCQGYRSSGDLDVRDDRVHYARSETQERCREDLSPEKERRLSKSAPNLLTGPSTQRSQLIEERTQCMISSSNATSHKTIPTKYWPVFERDCMNWKLLPGRLSNQRDGNIGMNVPNITFINTYSEESLVNITVEDSPVIPPHLVASHMSTTMDDAQPPSSQQRLGPNRELIPDYLGVLELPSPAYPEVHLEKSEELMNALHEALNSLLLIPNSVLDSSDADDEQKGRAGKLSLLLEGPLQGLSTAYLEHDERITILELPPQAYQGIFPTGCDGRSTSLRDTWSSCSPRLINTSSPNASPPPSLLMERGYEDMEYRKSLPDSKPQSQIVTPTPSIASSTPPSTSPLLSGSYSLLRSSYQAPHGLFQTPSPALTPYPSLESSATTLEFGFAPTLNYTPGTYPTETYLTPPVPQSPEFEDWRDIPTTCAPLDPSRNSWPEPLHLRGGKDRHSLFTRRTLISGVEEGKIFGCNGIDDDPMMWSVREGSYLDFFNRFLFLRNR